MTTVELRGKTYEIKRVTDTDLGQILGVMDSSIDLETREKNAVRSLKKTIPDLVADGLIDPVDSYIYLHSSELLKIAEALKDALAADKDWIESSKAITGMIPAEKRTEYLQGVEAIAQSSQKASLHEDLYGEGSPNSRTKGGDLLSVLAQAGATDENRAELLSILAGKRITDPDKLAQLTQALKEWEEISK